MRAGLVVLAALLTGCNTLHALQGSSSKARVAEGVKKDAKATGDTVERGVHEVGSALGKAFKRGGEKLEESSK
jgi:predicted small secreted protein